MPNEPRFMVGDRACVIQSNFVVPEVRGACGLIREVHQGATFGDVPRETRRWDYLVAFGLPLGEQTLPEGLFEHAPNRRA